jgi:hypothetical protein
VRVAIGFGIDHFDLRTTFIPGRVHGTRVVRHVVGVKVREHHVCDIGRLPTRLQQSRDDTAAAIEQHAILPEFYKMTR